MAIKLVFIVSCDVVHRAQGKKNKNKKRNENQENRLTGRKSGEFFLLFTNGTRAIGKSYVVMKFIMDLWYPRRYNNRLKDLQYCFNKGLFTTNKTNKCRIVII